MKVLGKVLKFILAQVKLGKEFDYRVSSDCDNWRREYMGPLHVEEGVANPELTILPRTDPIYLELHGNK